VIDFHAHILPHVDDGSKNIDESLLMLKSLAEQNVKLVVATPHFYANDESVDEFIERRNVSYELLKVNVSGLDTESAKKGYINGSYSISPGRDFIYAMTSEFGSSSVVSSLLTGISLDVDVSSSENKNSASIGVSYNGNSFGTVTVSLDTGDANDVQMISSAKTPERYVQDLDPSAFQAVISALNSAGVPSAYTDLLRQYIDYYM